MTPKQCLWCGDFYLEGMEGICRRCWEKNQFKDEEKQDTQEQEGEQ